MPDLSFAIIVQPLGRVHNTILDKVVSDLGTPMISGSSINIPMFDTSG